MKIAITKKRLLIFAAAVFFLLDAYLVCARTILSKTSNAVFYCGEFSESYGKTNALNMSARFSVVSEEKYAFFAFTEKQRAALEKIYVQSSFAALTVRLGVQNAQRKRYENFAASAQPLYYGFIYAEDFDDAGKFRGTVKKPVSAGTDLRNFIKNDTGETLLDLSLAVEKDLPRQNLPKGFFIFAASPVRVYAVNAGAARVGFDLTKSIPFYGLAATGGTFSARPSSVDFSGCVSVFPSTNSKYSVMPQIELLFVPPEEGYGTKDAPIKVRVNAGGEVFSILQTPSAAKTELQSALLKSPFNYFSLETNAALVGSLLMKPNNAELITRDGVRTLLPLKTDLELILGGRRDNWRCADYELYEWDRFPHVLFFDFRNYAVQSNFFLRLSFFTEKAGFRGRLLSDEELAGKHSYNAHDYSAASLAQFFTEAARLQFPLNEKEKLFRDILIANAVIIPEGGAYKAGEGAVISIAQESQRWLRRSLLAHESWHSVFFINEDFRNAVSAVYYTIDPKSLAFMQGYWSSQPSLGYDTNDDFLMKNEFMAYLMQQPLSRTASYFVQLAERPSVEAALPALSRYVKQTEGKAFEDAARALETYAYDNWGLAAGRVSLITRE
ncbi:MAG: hypothetical protein ACTTKL_08395 [Treponema sp.]